MIEDPVPSPGGRGGGVADEAGDVVLVGVGGEDVFELAVFNDGVEVIFDGRGRVFPAPGVDEDVVIPGFDVNRVAGIGVP